MHVSSPRKSLTPNESSQKRIHSKANKKLQRNYFPNTLPVLTKKSDRWLTYFRSTNMAVKTNCFQRTKASGDVDGLSLKTSDNGL